MENTRECIDHTGHRMAFPFPPQRIVSLVPSQTELLFDLGLGSRIVGRTKFCVHPRQQVSSVQVIGGTKNIRLDAIRKLKPDLVIGNKEENDKQSIEALRAFVPVWISDIVGVNDAIQLVSSFGEMTATVDKANELKIAILASLETVKGIFSGKTVYLIWRNPWMAAGRHTFVHSMLDWLGFTNVVSQSRYPEYDTDNLATLAPDFVFLPSEPYPFKESHIREVLNFLPSSQIYLVNGEMFSWYGSRLLQCSSYFHNLKARL